jgi:hypothetical protein
MTRKSSKVLGPWLPRHHVGIGAVEQHDCRSIARTFVAQMHGAAIGQLQPLRRLAAVFRLHLFCVRVRNPKDQEGGDQDRRQDAKHA